jgi:hypothetical protein
MEQNQTEADRDNSKNFNPDKLTDGSLLININGEKKEYKL